MRRPAIVSLSLSLACLAACGEDTPARSDADATSPDVAPDTTPDATPDATGGDATASDTDDVAATDIADDTTPDTTSDTTGDTQPETDSGCAPPMCALLAEDRAATALAEAVDDPTALTAFLRDVPKGGDLHHHLSGSVYAETYLEWALDDGGYCIDLRQSSYLALTRTCGANTAPVPEPGDPLFDDVVAAWSMEGFDGSGGESGHDHFFATFGKFGAISGSHGLMLADVMRRAASENQVYIEPMLTSNGPARSLGDSVWSATRGGATLTVADLPEFYDDLLAASGMDNAIDFIVDDVVESEAIASDELACDSGEPEAACAVTTRYQVYISRSGTLPGVFAQMVAAYEASIRDERVVGLNLVGPEDNVVSLQRYDVQMAMLGFLYDRYRVTGKSPLRLSLHAGELADAYLPSGWELDEINHITKAIERARAERIGHGLDLNFEADPDAILEQLRDGQILVEICLASNDIILEVSGVDHPLHDYLDADVPVALGTDDQGVARSSLAGEYRRAVVDQGLDYHTLKRMARMSLEYAFLPGESLWFDLEAATPATPCVHPFDQVLGLDTPPDPCVTYLVDNERAGLQYELERRFRLFEAAH